MDVAHILLGCPWLYDYDFRHFGRDNIYEFVHQRKTIRLFPTKPLDPLMKLPSKANPTDNRLQLLSHKEFEREFHNNGLMFALVTKACSHPISESHNDHPLDVTSLLEEFIDVTLNDLPEELPPIRDIQHAVDLVPDSQFLIVPTTG
ncbi:uncharacterized protein LOC111404414 [Olea europaea var. sylvestris]|uniref:uncharacterized protein LOC111404414 n=1 Tax=Olea europaea var. sylvestris TaxID=158386 RepID=UPI000C1D2E04|nr:uncharacterized protein LOC111404414 [Olea europaea var. sylvestris]